MIDRRIWDGVTSLLDDYVKVRGDDTIVILYTVDSYEAAIWVTAALELRGIRVKRMWMTAVRDPGFQQRLRSILPPPVAIPDRLVILGFERDTMSHTEALACILSGYGQHKCVVFRAIGTGAALFAEALAMPPAALSARNTALLKRFMHATRLRITTRGGTDMTVTLDSRRHRWISNRGLARPGSVVVLPAGEIATFPASIDGRFVADFAFNLNAVTERDARLHQHPVSVVLQAGRAISVHCADAGLSRFLAACFENPCTFNVGELGFGTNSAIHDAVPANSHINERRPGVHLGFGQHNQDPGVVDYQCKVHLDLIARGGMVWVDEDPVPVDLENILVSDAPHPDGPRDEDVFSPEVGETATDDCCGLVAADAIARGPDAA